LTFSQKWFFSTEMNCKETSAAHEANDECFSFQNSLLFMMIENDFIKTFLTGNATLQILKHPLLTN
jgi:hypothetical protein